MDVARIPSLRRRSGMALGGYSALSFSPSISIAGVTINVSTVATTSPPAMAEESSVHHCVEGAP